MFTTLRELSIEYKVKRRQISIKSSKKAYKGLCVSNWELFSSAPTLTSPFSYPRFIHSNPNSSINKSVRASSARSSNQCQINAKSLLSSSNSSPSITDSTKNKRITGNFMTIETFLRVFLFISRFALSEKTSPL